MKTSSSCELTPRVPSPPPCQLPPGPWTSLASSALCLDCLHANPSTTSVDQSAEACPYPTTVRLSGCRWRPTSSKDAAKRRVKSGNFNWFYRQFYYALNRRSSCAFPFSIKLVIKSQVLVKGCFQTGPAHHLCLCLGSHLCQPPPLLNCNHA